ncbi:MAG: histidine kinase [Lachnospiraceae bacterium]
MKNKIRSIVMLSIALLSLVAFLSIQLIASSYQKALYQAVASSLSYSSRELANQMDSINTMADMFLANTTIQDNLTILKSSNSQTQRTTASQVLYNALSEYYFNFRKHQISYMSLYQDNFSTHTYMATINKLPDDVTEALISKAKAGSGATLWVTDYSEEYGLFMVKELRETKHLRLTPLGVLIVNVDIKSLMNRTTSTSSSYGETHYLLYDDHTVIYDSANLKENPQFGYSSSPSRYGRIKQNGNDFFYVHGTIDTTDWDYACAVPFGAIADALSFSRNLCLFIIAAAIMLSLVLSTRLIHSLTRHFDNLIIKMQNFGDGQSRPLLTRTDYASRKDELGILHTQFDLMVHQVNELIRSNYLNEILRKEAQLKALETQINPHFLYNTLESINWRAKALGAKDISSMAESLGKLLRITLDQKTKHFPLRQELELIHCYMTIQQFRYEERLHYEMKVPDQLLNYEVLKLTLQPLVENAIRYGLEENTEACQIQIMAEASDDHLYLYVKNNGSYFEDNLLHKLKSHEISPHGFGIGLLNIHERLQLTYGLEFGLTLYNEGDLAVARIAFPIPSTL